ncbi:thiamine biosynthesis protein ThiS [Haliangium ochraceum DSM 14365]|uniref:Thiamine biosynthesis protein ThiS n=1 Tax=Haliangium ochraceum (strain DSM 14365 / JCM 11303 / SMP-2) TaxID=502025 RepID=D0LJM7_HALO1|nr:sulfur carrier protein ThiS [Haliangium ochraceum]ACY16601.1 thiamine biosynthesis protein ThiS [Haliangium ochraceum DSM 14365]
MSESSSRSPESERRGEGAATAASALAVTINGERRVVDSGTTVTELLVQLGLGDRRVAVERNREVVPRAEHASTTLSDGDTLEVVGFVGGG